MLLNRLQAAARKVIWVRDYHADHGYYPPNTVDLDNQCFDDWAADLLDKALR